MGNSCNYEHEEIEEDTICCSCMGRRGRYLPKYILGPVSLITVVSSYLEFEGCSGYLFVGHKSAMGSADSTQTPHVYRLSLFESLIFTEQSYVA